MQHRPTLRVSSHCLLALQNRIKNPGLALAFSGRIRREWSACRRLCRGNNDIFCQRVTELLQFPPRLETTVTPSPPAQQDADVGPPCARERINLPRGDLRRASLFASVVAASCSNAINRRARHDDKAPIFSAGKTTTPGPANRRRWPGGPTSPVCWPAAFAARGHLYSHCSAHPECISWEMQKADPAATTTVSRKDDGGLLINDPSAEPRRRGQPRVASETITIAAASRSA